MICKKHKQVCRILNYIECLLIFASAVMGCISISAFTSLVGIHIEIKSYAATIKTCARTAIIKKYKSTVKKEKKKHDKVLLLA